MRVRENVNEGLEAEKESMQVELVTLFKQAFKFELKKERKRNSQREREE